MSILTTIIVLTLAGLSKGHRINYTNIEDLSYAFGEDTLYWLANETFKLTTVQAEDIPNFGWLATKQFAASEHGGTHLDAPYHFSKTGWKVTDIPTCHWVAEGVLIDVKDKVGGDGDFQLLPEHLEEWVAANGQIRAHTVLFVNFGWASKYTNRVSYFGNENPPYKFPGISKPAAEWIVANGNIIGIGVDVPSLDGGKSTTLDAHKSIAAANIYGLENVALNNTNLPPKGFDVIALPLKITNGSGAPVRILALY